MLDAGRRALLVVVPPHGLSMTAPFWNGCALRRSRPRLSRRAISARPDRTGCQGRARVTRTGEPCRRHRPATPGHLERGPGEHRSRYADPPTCSRRGVISDATEGKLTGVRRSQRRIAATQQRRGSYSATQRTRAVTMRTASRRIDQFESLPRRSGLPRTFSLPLAVRYPAWQAGAGHGRHLLQLQA
jgi:hypothetical protein